MSNRIGIDTGGTFTDFIWLDESGEPKIHKELSSSEDPSLSVIQGIQVMNVAAATSVFHGSTVATNAILERQGARTALITTAGFGDVLAIGRQNRPELYSLTPQKPEPLVAKGWRFEIRERVSSDGTELVRLDRGRVKSILRKICDEEIESVAICLLFSFLMPVHERQIQSEIIKLHTDWKMKKQIPPESTLHISLSSEVLPEFREYERTSTTVINAYVAPLIAGYLQRMSEGLSPRPFSLMQSNGGVVGVDTAVKQAARSVLSGPAGGVVGARYVAGSAGIEKIITFDMGGTSTDVALCDGSLPLTSEGEIDSMPLRLPMIDIHTVGAGGGSLARVDPGGALFVGPESAGAYPGPACYPNMGSRSRSVGGLRATITDANLVLGRLDADNFLGGAMVLNRRRAHQALSEIAKLIGRSSVEAAALDMINVANATMERAIRRISVERGFDPRRFTMVAFGGAGPLHACDLAKALNIPRVLIPTAPGVLSALGMLTAPPTMEFSQTIMRTIQEDRPNSTALEEDFKNIETKASGAMAAEGYSRDSIAIQRSLDMRYLGQSFELRVRLPDSGGKSSIVSLFHEAHFRRYGYRQEDAQVEIVNMRATAAVDFEPPNVPSIERGEADAGQAAVGQKVAWFNEEPETINLYSRSLLKGGNMLSGPAVIFQYDSTTVIPPDWQAAVNNQGQLLIDHIR